MRRYLLAILAVALLAPTALAAPPQFTVTAIDGLSYGAGLNNLGDATGYNSFSGVGTRAFLWDGAMHNLGTLGGRSTGTAINDSGQVVGFYDPVADTHRAYLYSPGSGMQDIGTLGGGQASAYGINNKGMITGNAQLPNGQSHAFIYDGTMHDLGVLDGTFSGGSDINESGHVVGLYFTADSRPHAFVYDGTMRALDMPAGVARSTARSLNDAGEIVGWLDYEDEDGNVVETRAFVYDGTVHELGVLAGNTSRAFDINNLGQIVGDSSTANGQRAVLFSDGQIYDLNSLIPSVPGMRITSAVQINDRGQILARGKVRNIFDTDFILTPVPEPSSVLLAMIACCGLAVRGWLRLKQ